MVVEKLFYNYVVEILSFYFGSIDMVRWWRVHDGFGYFVIRGLLLIMGKETVFVFIVD